MEPERPVSNEDEFEHWLASAFESERRRLRERAAARDAQANSAPDRAVTDEKKKEKGDVAAA